MLGWKVDLLARHRSDDRGYRLWSRARVGVRGRGRVGATVRVGARAMVRVRVRVRVSVSAWSSLRAGVAPLANDEWHEVRQLDVGL